ncbi:hypothetical protein Barb6_03884 [Bacteroidales bacterium Barb6]|nr:hypothetical protein Barb6_03884 [Bacteroidales bacterium Barb6]
MWGYRKNATDKGVLKGYRISAPHGAEQNVGFAERATQGSPARTADFSPTWSECGMWGYTRSDTVRGVLKERYKLHGYNATYIHSVILSGYPWRHLP